MQCYYIYAVSVKSMRGVGVLSVELRDGLSISATAKVEPVGNAVAHLLPPELTVVIPTYNESDNVPLLVDRLRSTLRGVHWEVIFVDDNSPDGTGRLARALGELDRRVRCIRRIGRRGLAGACLEGILASQARYVAVMDGDLQHDASLLAVMLDRMSRDDVDLVVASRDLASEEASEGLSAARRFVSRVSNASARRLLGVKLKDPMSGFFVVRREIVEDVAPALSTQGFKILLDIVATAGDRLRFVELPYVFGKRIHGDSKFDMSAALAFVQLLLSRFTDDAISIRFVLFCLVGLTGVGVHMAALAALKAFTTFQFAVMQTAATAAAIAWNFAINNLVTYRDQRLFGWQFIAGLLRFELICAVGAVSNLGIAFWIYGYQQSWWLAGLGGAMLSGVWNYVVSAAFVWHRR